MPYANCIILTAGDTFTKPATWNDSDNRVTCVGAGAGGSAGYGTGGIKGGAGGGSGAFAQGLNVSLAALSAGASVPIVIGSGGIGGTASNTNNSTTLATSGGPLGSAGGDTVFNAASLAAAVTAGSATTVAAQGAPANSNSFTADAKGLAASSVGNSLKRDGSLGGSAPSYMSGGGGGAPGPDGLGGTGSAGSTGTGNEGAGGGGGANGGANAGAASGATGGAGGNNRSATGGGAAGTSGNAGGNGSSGGGGGGGGGFGGAGGNGSNELLWTDTADASQIGPGAGGGGGGGYGGYATSVGGAPGYGAGGGGGWPVTGSKGGANGGAGFIIVEWNPASGGSSSSWRGGGLVLGLGLGMGFSRGGGGSPVAASPNFNIPGDSNTNLPTNLSSYTALPTLTAQTATIASQELLTSILNDSTKGGVYYLAPGDYDMSTWYSRSITAYHTSQLIIRPSDPNNRPRFLGPPLSEGPSAGTYPVINAVPGSGNIWFDGIDIQAGTYKAYRTNPLVSITGGTNFRFSRCRPRGLYIPAGQAMSGDYDLCYSHTAFRFTACSGTIFDHNDIQDVANGVDFSTDGTNYVRCTETLIVANDFLHVAEDCFHLNGMQRALFAWNKAKDGRPAGDGVDLDNSMHCDMFQTIPYDNTGTDNDAAFTNIDITFLDNFAISTAGGYYSTGGLRVFYQFFWLTSDQSTPNSMVRCYVGRNEVCGPGNKFVVIGEGNDLRIVNNTARRSDSSAFDNMTMRVTFYGSQNAYWANNVYQGVDYLNGAGVPIDPATVNIVDGGGNTQVLTEYSDAQFEAYETAWIARRTAAGF